MSKINCELTNWPESPEFRMIPYRVVTHVVGWPSLGTKPPTDLDLIGRISYAIGILEDVIVIDPETRGGVPVLTGTRVPISRLFAEIASDRTVSDIAEDKELDVENVRKVFQGFAAYMARSFTK